MTTKVKVGLKESKMVYYSVNAAVVVSCQG